MLQASFVSVYIKEYEGVLIQFRFSKQMLYYGFQFVEFYWTGRNMMYNQKGFNNKE